MPGVFTQSLNFLSPDEISYQYQLGTDKTMINVGSVGQPRDGDPRACYVVLEDDLVTFRRVEYPVEKTIEKIYDTPELDNFLGRSAARWSLVARCNFWVRGVGVFSPRARTVSTKQLTSSRPRGG